MKILHAIASMKAEYGGTVEALRQLILNAPDRENIGHTEHEVFCLDAAETAHSTSFPCPVHRLGPTASFYGYSPLVQPWLQAHLPSFDAVVIHGCWQYHGLAAFRACRKADKPYLIYPHGMLDPWFKKRYPLKHLKKWLYWPWAEYRILKHARKVVFTSNEELQGAARSFWLYQANPVVIPLGVRVPEGDPTKQKALFLKRHPQLAGHQLLLYLGRIHEKKGLDLLLKAALRWNQSTHTPLTTPPKRLQLVIAGPLQGGRYADEVRQLATKLADSHGPIAGVCWTGMLSGDEKWGAFRCAHAFFLPSHQENFGMAVAEALACTLPVVISKRVNIWREVVEAGAGIAENDDENGTYQALCRCLSLNEAARSEMATKAQSLFQSRFRADVCSRSFHELLAAETTPPPE
jgi:glycosyltransferase involved in cell wall biosynthesis